MSSSSSFHRNGDSKFPIFPTNNNNNDNNNEKKKKRSCFASASLLGLGCRSPASSEAYAPASAASAAAAAETVRSSPAEWEGKRPSFSLSSSRSRKNSKKKNDDMIKNHHQPSSSAAADFSCPPFPPPFPPRFPFDDDDSVDYVVRRHHSMMLARAGRYDADRVQRDIMKFQARMTGGLNICDRYRDLRLDVDRMSYEELLELGDRIGHVSTGLREDEISESLRKMKHSVFDSSQRCFSIEMERKCSICQEEYEVNEDIGKLECGHSYHMYCIKQWLLQKNACPVCKTAVTKT